MAGTLKALEILKSSPELRVRLKDNTAWYREAMGKAGLTILAGEHPICPVMIGDAALAGQMAAKMLERGVYVVGFSYPVVPQGKARIRTQVSASHTQEDLKFAVEQFAAVKKELAI